MRREGLQHATDVSQRILVVGIFVGEHVLWVVSACRFSYDHQYVDNARMNAVVITLFQGASTAVGIKRHITLPTANVFRVFRACRVRSVSCVELG